MPKLDGGAAREAERRAFRADPLLHEAPGGGRVEVAAGERLLETDQIRAGGITGAHRSSTKVAPFGSASPPVTRDGVEVADGFSRVCGCAAAAPYDTATVCGRDDLTVVRPTPNDRKMSVLIGRGRRGTSLAARSKRAWGEGDRDGVSSVQGLQGAIVGGPDAARGWRALVRGIADGSAQASFCRRPLPARRSKRIRAGLDRR